MRNNSSPYSDNKDPYAQHQDSNSSVLCIELGQGKVLITTVPGECCCTGKPSIVFSRTSAKLKVGQGIVQDLTAENIIAAISVTSIESLDVLARAIEALRKNVNRYELAANKKQQTFLEELIDEKC